MIIVQFTYIGLLFHPLTCLNENFINPCNRGGHVGVFLEYNNCFLLGYAVSSGNSCVIAQKSAVLIYFAAEACSYS